MVKTSILILGLLVTGNLYAQEADAQMSEAALAGETIYEASCRTCHNFDNDQTGPALKGVVKRQGGAWLTTWIQNPAKIISSGDKHAVEMKEKYGSVMPALGLSDEEIAQVIAYLEVGKDPVVEVAAPVEGGEQQSGETDSSSVNIVLGIVLLVLLLIIAILVLLTSAVSKQLKSKDEAGELDDSDSEFFNQKHSILAVLKHPAFIGIVIGVSLLLGAYLGVTKGLYGIGVQQGYKPVQPIAFSHKLHAGEKGIDCNYCHTGVRKAKHANIPSASICMNCHIKIKPESPRIQQIYKAIDYDPETKTFGTDIKPIQWVRIHNLPDHVYFNHSQHVKLAGLECEECHGDIKEMEEVYQYSPLTMGWCIDCHEKKEVKHAAGNDYYQDLLDAHEEAGGESGKMTVEDIGGTECGKCHY